MNDLGGIVILSIILFNFASSLLLIFSPILLGVALFHLIQKLNIQKTISATVSISTIALILIWPVSGLYKLNTQCNNINKHINDFNKIGPINSLFLDGPGMWSLNGKIDVERKQYGSPNLYWKWGDKNKHIRNITEDNLLSTYKIELLPPKEASYSSRYLTNATVKISDRKTDDILVKLQEPAWGGGIVGAYLSSLTKLNPFHSSDKYLSCGFAGNEIGLYRGSSKARYTLYKKADSDLINKIFILDRI